MGKIVGIKEVKVGDRVRVVNTWCGLSVFKGKTGTVVDKLGVNTYINFDDSCSNNTYAYKSFNHCYYAINEANEQLELISKDPRDFDFSRFGCSEVPARELINHLMDWIDERGKKSLEETVKPVEPPKEEIPFPDLKVGDIVQIGKTWCKTSYFKGKIGMVVELIGTTQNKDQLVKLAFDKTIKGTYRWDKYPYTYNGYRHEIEKVLFSS